MEYDRLDICEAYFLWLSDNHAGQGSREYERLCKLTEPGKFRPAVNLRYETLSENGQCIYDNIGR